MTHERKKLGQEGEDLACGFLLSKNYKILERNFKSHIGEIDIIAQDKNELVFVEVKTKIGQNWGLPQEMVNKKKQKKLVRVSLGYLQEKNISNQTWRIDVIGISMNQGKVEKLEHFKNAVWENA